MELSLDAVGDLLVPDYYNHRVLLWQANILAHVPAGACDKQCFIPASHVWGQYGSFATRLANNSLIPAGVSSRCTDITLETLASACTLNGPSAAVMDRDGDLYVSDTANNRVLEYDRALQTNHQDATRVYGQSGSFTSINWNLDGVAAISLWHPLGLGIDGTGHLWVADFRNMRVLRFPALGSPDATTADHALGQSDNFSASKCVLDARGLCGPTSIAFDGAGHAFVSDGFNSRILEYVNPE